jgi:hypothetical protein
MNMEKITGPESLRRSLGTDPLVRSRVVVKAGVILFVREAIELIGNIEKVTWKECPLRARQRLRARAVRVTACGESPLPAFGKAAKVTGHAALFKADGLAAFGAGFSQKTIVVLAAPLRTIS